MKTVFIGGSRHITRLPDDVKKRLDNVAVSGHRVVVGDANGADKAIQKHFNQAHYGDVVVYCSGGTPRNNVGSWEIQRVNPPRTAKGFQFYAAKDREMARAADFGLMIWDGKSSGTLLNVLRLARAGKICVLFNIPERDVINIKSMDQWTAFLHQCTADLRLDLKNRATPEEWFEAQPPPQGSLLLATECAAHEWPTRQDAAAVDDALRELNNAFASGDAATIMDTLGMIARRLGMSRVARDTGLARESLYRSLDIGGNPEFATVLKVISSVGLRLEAKSTLPAAHREDSGRDRAPGT